MGRTVTALAVAVTLMACSQTTSPDERPLVLATVAPITNLVHNIAGDRVTLIGLVPEGRDAHTFEPAPSAAARLARADLVFVNGLALEDSVIQLAGETVDPGVPIVVLGQEVAHPGELITDRSLGGTSPNPHLWVDPTYASEYATVIARELSALDPAGAPSYRANLRSLTGTLDALDAAIRASSETLPRAGKVLLTYHDAWPYFARTYGWRLIGAVQPADLSEPSPREVAALIDQVRALHVPAIFGSAEFPSPVLEQIARETGAEYVTDLRDDDLPGEAGDAEHSYAGMMSANAIRIIEASGGDAASLRAVPVANLVSDEGVGY